MPITVYSPHSGQPVKVRDEDVGRAVRDGEGRIFYVVARSDGSGHYASPTRKGSERDAQRYDKMLETQARGEEGASAQQQADRQALHDATGKRRLSPVLRVILILVLLLAFALAGYVLILGGDLPWLGSPGRQQPAPREHPGDSPSTAPEPGQGQGASSNSSKDRGVARPSNGSGVAGSVGVGEPRSFAGRDSLDRYLADVPSADEARLSPKARQMMDFHRESDQSGDAGGHSPLKGLGTGSRSPRVALGVGRSSQHGGARDSSPESSKAPTLEKAFTDLGPPNSEMGRRLWLRANRGEPFERTASGLQYRIEHAGDGETAKAGMWVQIDLTAAMYHPDQGLRVIDTTKGDKPLGFVLWSGEVGQGLDRGVAGMRVGEERTLLIPLSMLSAERPQLSGKGKSEDVVATSTANEGSDSAYRLLCSVGLKRARPGVRRRTVEAGQGPPAYPGQTVRVHLKAFLPDSDEPFQNTRRTRQPMQITLGAGQVIRGLDLGLIGIRSGEQRIIDIPSYLAYGQRGAGPLIPPETDLIYHVQLLEILRPNRKADAE